MPNINGPQSPEYFLNQSKSRRGSRPIEPVGQPVDEANEAVRLKKARNRANTLRNSVKVEQFLMEVEKVHGFARSWALRERLEQGQVSLEEAMRR